MQCTSNNIYLSHYYLFENLLIYSTATSINVPPLSLGNLKFELSNAYVTNRCYVFHSVKSSGNPTRVGNHLQNVTLMLFEYTDLSPRYKSHATCTHHTEHSSALLTTTAYCSNVLNEQPILPCFFMMLHILKQAGWFNHR